MGLAFTGFAIGCRATRRILPALGIEPAVGLVVSAWPLLFPEFFPDMARIGPHDLFHPISRSTLSDIDFLLSHEVHNPLRVI